jgi:hypothetical protein
MAAFFGGVFGWLIAAFVPSKSTTLNKANAFGFGLGCGLPVALMFLASLSLRNLLDTNGACGGDSSPFIIAALTFSIALIAGLLARLLVRTP